MGKPLSQSSVCVENEKTFHLEKLYHGPRGNHSD
jgi:hypothetical protein